MADLQTVRNRLQSLIPYAGENDYLLSAGERWIYGLNDAGEAGFFMRSLDDPLRNVSVMPLRLARRMQEFTGGQLLSVRFYMRRIIELIDEILSSKK